MSMTLGVLQHVCMSWLAKTRGGSAVVSHNAKVCGLRGAETTEAETKGCWTLPLGQVSTEQEAKGHLS